MLMGVFYSYLYMSSLYWLLTCMVVYYISAWVFALLFHGSGQCEGLDEWDEQQIQALTLFRRHTIVAYVFIVNQSGELLSSEQQSLIN